MKLQIMKGKVMEYKMVYKAVHLPKKLVNSIQEIANDKEISFAEVTRRALDLYLDNYLREIHNRKSNESKGQMSK